MKNLQNLHTHSTYDDGKNTLREMIEIAIGKGFDSIGFSGHSYMHYSPGASMSLEGTEEYKKEIALLKEEYKGQFDIFCGLEFDRYSEIDLSGYEYLIGSVHYLKIDDKHVGFDRREYGLVKNVIDTYFDGKGIEFAKEYYKTLATLPECGDFDIIGHFDVVSKHVENGFLFDVNSKEYLDAAIEAAEILAGKIPYFEVNTGPIPRNYRSYPYPDKRILKELNRLGFGAVISSDCHNGQYLDSYFEEAEQILMECGFKERYILTDDGFIPVKIQR